VENVRKLTPPEDENRINVHAYWKVFWRKKFYLIVPLVLSMIIAVFGVKRLTPIYESHTMLAMGDKSILSPTIERYVPSADNRTQMVNQQVRAMIETRVTRSDFLKLIVEDLGLQRSAEVRRSVELEARENPSSVPLDELVMRHLVGVLAKKIEVSSPMPGFFTIAVYDTDPATAYRLAEKISETFIAVSRQEQIQGIRQAGAFSDEQLAIYKEKLETSEKELARVRLEMSDSQVENNPVTSANVTFARALKQTIGADADRSAIALKRVREKLVDLLKVVPSSDVIASDETVHNCENKLIAYGEEKLLRDLSGTQQAPPPPDKYNEAVADLRARLTEIVKREYGKVSPDVHPLIVEYYYQRSINDYNQFINRKLQGYIDQYSRSYGRRPSLEREVNRLTQDVETNKAIYRAFLESKTSARIDEAAQTTDLGLGMNIIERAEKPLSPVKPNKIKILLLAVMFGGACGLGAVIVTEYIDDSFRSIEEVERVLKTPVLGTVPKMVAGFSWERKQRGVMIIAWIVGVAVFVAILSGGLYLYANRLKSSGLGIELRDENPATEVQK
jgi:succinoglycan biosynthesis transport protein ExoP